GLGAAVARRFVAEGATVVVSDLDDAEGEALIRTLGDAARYQHHDVTDEAAWQSIVDFTVAEFGRLDVLVNNAGVYRNAPLVDTSLEDYLAVIGVNQVGTFLGLRTAAVAMTTTGG